MEACCVPHRRGAPYDLICSCDLHSIRRGSCAGCMCLCMGISANPMQRIKGESLRPRVRERRGGMSEGEVRRTLVGPSLRNLPHGLVASVLVSMSSSQRFRLIGSYGFNRSAMRGGRSDHSDNSIASCSLLLMIVSKKRCWGICSKVGVSSGKTVVSILGWQKSSNFFKKGGCQEFWFRYYISLPTRRKR